MQVAVCDDNEMCLLELQEQLASISMVEKVFPFSDLKHFLNSVGNGNFYDAVFMDIDWGHSSSGIDTAGKLMKLSPETKTIYVTGHGDRYSQNIFLHRANLSGFLTKPVDHELLKANLQKVADALPLSEQPTVVLRKGSNMVSVPCHEIYYVESKGRTIEMHTAAGVEVFYGKLESIISLLPTWFVQCHKSFIVNMRQIQRFHPAGILLKNGALVPASRSRIGKAKESYFAFIGEMF
ncbi:LytTR family DNA-binding domain-containing protein [Ruminococcaceae bacterium OttesenSCG-928-D13]|nr:LytTR family DNA-binding domain-containing protein [Ruminococcaceae bacterium OttesenSCG-928-D13]